MTTAIGVGTIGSTLARDLVRGERVVLAARDEATAEAPANELGDLASAAHRVPWRAVLFSATDDKQAASAAGRLITAAGFDSVKAGGMGGAARLELPGGDLRHRGGLEQKLTGLEEARAAVAACPAVTP